MPIALPGVSRRVTVRGSGLLTGARIYVDGAPAPRAGLFAKFKIPADDASIIEARVVNALTGLVVTVGKQKYPVGPQSPAWMGILVLLPIGLVVTGGALGGLLGATAMVVNRKIAVSGLGTGAKVALMLGVLVGVVVVAVAVAVAIRANLPH
jgi:hypothetical protein